MLVFIAANESGYYLIDEYGSPARGVWFSACDDAVAYCDEHGLIVGCSSFEDE